MRSMGKPRPRPRSDGSTYWQVPFRLDGTQTSESFDDKKAADRFAKLVKQVGPAEARSIVRSARSGGHAVPTLTEWVAHHLEHATSITPGTRGEYRRLAARSFLPTLGGYPVDVVTRDMVRRWVRDYQGAGHSAKTVTNAHGLLSTVLASAVEAGHRADNPAKGVKVARGERDEMVVLTTAEFARLMARIPQRWHPLVLTAAGTGLRWGELTALHWRDVDLDARVPVVRVRQAWKRGETGTRALGVPKTPRSRRTVSLGQGVARALDPLRGEPDTLVFRAERGGRLHHQRWHPSVWRPAVDAADLGKRPRFHDLRHSHVSWLIDAGRPPLEIRDRLGHESIKTTMDVYGHLFPGSLEASAAAVDLAMSEALPELEA